MADPLTPPPDAKERPASPDLADAEYLCPNCVTPWKCNGPHIPRGVARADREAAPAIRERIEAALDVWPLSSMAPSTIAEVTDRVVAALGVGEAP